ncbi:hypothetical protein AZF07_00145 [Corynebacterium diphtheriae subsp. lausannense]|nr:hypothetical protein AZF07_00145 [Corynebacterium diphtheriae subsp. lausannense]
MNYTLSVASLPQRYHMSGPKNGKLSITNAHSSFPTLVRRSQASTWVIMMMKKRKCCDEDDAYNEQGG